MIAFDFPIVLPVTLTDFRATKNYDDVIIEWETSSESRNKTFILEKSINGSSFEPIDSLQGAGNSEALPIIQVLIVHLIKG